MNRAPDETSHVKVQLRAAIMSLAQLQGRKDSEAASLRRDIATLLRAQQVWPARIKAQKLIQEDAMGDLLEILEMHLGQLLEHSNDLGQCFVQTPYVVEAASSIIYAAPHVVSNDLDAVCSSLSHHLGSDFVHSAEIKRSGRIVSAVARILSSTASTPDVLNATLQQIAKDYGIRWIPEPPRAERSHLICRIMDPQTSPAVDIGELRRLCAFGLPDEPIWLRPRVWKLLLGILPMLKSSWAQEVKDKREAYYGLVRQLLDPLSSLPRPRNPVTSKDAIIVQVSQQLSGVPPILFNDLVNEPESFKLCPLDETASEDIKIGCAGNLNTRLQILREGKTLADSDPPALPGLLQAHSITQVHPKHTTALLRLLYMHASVNAGRMSPFTAMILLPLYIVANHEVNPEELAHTEADTFWMFEAIAGDFSELGEDESANHWMKKFSERLAWADSELSFDLQAKGLDPALPHYSYKWLASLLTCALPMQSIPPVWDTLLSCLPRNRDKNPKIDRLLDICSAILIRSRVLLLRLGKKPKGSSKLGEGVSEAPPLSPLHAWELGNAFSEGISILRSYPLEVTNSIDDILQTAFDLGCRRDEDGKTQRKEKLSLGAKLKATMWKGFTNQESSPDTSSEESEDIPEEFVHGNAETPSEETSGFTARLANSVWRGITNQSAMDPPPSPVSPTSPSSVSSHHDAQSDVDGSPDPKPSVKTYADRIKGSDALATLAKIGSNWRARTMTRSWSPVSSADIGSQASPSPQELRYGSDSAVDQNVVHSPPHIARLQQFPYNSAPLQNGSPKHGGTLSETSLLDKTKALHASLTSLAQRPLSGPIAKSGPRPLLLGSSSPVTSPPNSLVSRSAGSTPGPDRRQWDDVTQWSHRNSQHYSQSSISSLSPPPDTFRSPISGRSDLDAENGSLSRRVPLNRKSISPMAPGSRRKHNTPTSTYDSRLLSPPFSALVELENPKNADSHTLFSARSYPVAEEVKADKTVSAGNNDRPSQKKAPNEALSDHSSDHSSDPQGSFRSLLPRPKHHAPRPPSLNIEQGNSDVSRHGPIRERKLSGSNRLAVEHQAEDHAAKTPRAATFSPDPTAISPKTMRYKREVSIDTHTHAADTSGSSSQIILPGQRTRKVSMGKREGKKISETSAEDGDDEGYDDLLSAYESESSQVSSLR